MSFSAITTPKSRRDRVGIGAACLFGGLAAATIAGTPTASAMPVDQCSASGLSGTVSSAVGAAQQYLATHPDANQAVSAAMNQPRADAAANLRGYFTATPAEYYELRGILAPIGDAQRTCGVTVLPGELASAYTMFMAG
jgi:heme-binding protein